VIRHISVVASSQTPTCLSQRRGKHSEKSCLLTRGGEESKNQYANLFNRFTAVHQLNSTVAKTSELEPEAKSAMN